jgi:GTPase
MADYALILVNSRHPPTHMTHHHLNLCVSFGIHVVIVFTKTDGCPEHAFKTSKAEVCKLLRRSDIAKRPFEIRTEEDIATCMGKLGTLAPMISTSCVTGEGIELLQKMLFSLPKRRRHERKLKRSFEYLVDDIFNVPGVGSVVSGFVNAGQLDVGPNAHVYVGPMDDGSFMKTVAKSAHIARINTATVTSGQSACLALALGKDMRKKLRRGMVVLKESPTATKEFEAEICVLKGEGTTIRRKYQAYVHILNVRQSAYAKKIEIVNNNALGLSSTHTALYGEDNEIVLRPGSRAKVQFEFAQRPVSIRGYKPFLFASSIGEKNSLKETQSFTSFFKIAFQNVFRSMCDPVCECYFEMVEFVGSDSLLESLPSSQLIDLGRFVRLKRIKSLSRSAFEQL